MGSYRIKLLHRPPDISQVRRVPPLVKKPGRLPESVVIAPLLAAGIGKDHVGLVAGHVVEGHGGARNSVCRLRYRLESISQIVIVSCKPALRIGECLLLPVLVVAEIMVLAIGPEIPIADRARRLN